MENTIIQETSHGSAILAYGSATSSPRRRLFLFIILIVLLVAVPALILTLIFFLGSAAIPTKPLFAISLTPSAIESKFSGALVTELPAPWRTALETNSSLPVILGLAATEQGTVAPYAIIPRSVSISTPAGTTVTKNTLTKTIVSESIKTASTPYRILLDILGKRKNADAGWGIHTNLLSLISGTSLQDEKDQEWIYGSLKGNRGTILLPEEEYAWSLSESAFFVLLGKQRPDQTLVSNALLTQGINLKETRSPDHLSIKGDGTLIATWSDPSNEERALIQVANGMTTGTPFILPDQDNVAQISTQAVSSTDSSNAIAIQGGWKQSSGEPSQWKTNCPGSVRFSIEGEALQNILLLFRATPSWREKVHSFAISTDQKKHIFCVNE